jgi:REP element-mobilizing transposase RayT/DNA-binding CsgD family transcriptional regulator
MTNHYHLLIETKEPNISDAMKRLNSLYSIYFNKKYHRSGHLWQGRFASYYLYDDVHFWYVAKYIERNPIKANMVKQIDHYKYQSFFQWKFKLEHYELIKDSKIFDMTLLEYEEFISSEIQEEILEKIYMSPKYIKKDGEMKILYKRLETFFEQDHDINRNTNIKKAYDYGYTKTEIADFLNISNTAVSKIL